MSAATLPAWADEAGLVGEHNRLRAIAEVQLGQDPADMGLVGLLGDDQSVTDLGVGEATGYQPQDLGLPAGEHAERCGRWRAGPRAAGELCDQPPGYGRGEQR